LHFNGQSRVTIDGDRAAGFAERRLYLDWAETRTL
jgi:hypothetical protein